MLAIVTCRFKRYEVTLNHANHHTVKWFNAHCTGEGKAVYVYFKGYLLDVTEGMVKISSVTNWIICLLRICLLSVVKEWEDH